MRRLLLIPILIACAYACEQSPTEEEQGRRMLAEARTCYRQGDYVAARDSILSLRQRFPMALEARREAILLLDSVELQLAGGDSLKTEFFRRKLQVDIEKLKE